MRDPRYQRLLNSKRWKELRVSMLQLHPLCQECLKHNVVRSAVDCHHIVPISASMTNAEMERLAFDPSNIACLCVPCHVKVHKDMGKGTKANRKERAAQRMSRWSEAIRRPALSEPGAVDFLAGASESEISLPSPVLRE